MKRVLISIFSAFFAVLACTTEQIAPTPADRTEETVILRAGFDAGDQLTRTIRQEDGKVFWSAGDRIAVVRGNQCKEFVSLNTVPQATADFEGVMPSGSGSFWAMHPYDPYANIQINGTCLVTTLPNTQVAVADTFDDDLFISVALADSDRLSFCHVVGGIKFSVTEPGIKRVALIATAGEHLAGLVGIRESGGRPVINITGYDSDMYSQIDLAPASGTFEVGKAYHFVTMPQSLSRGFTLVFEKESNLVATREVDMAVTIEAARFKTLMEADKNLTWQTPELSIGSNSLSLDAAGGAFKLNIRSFGSFHVDDSNCDWITHTDVSGDPRTPAGADYIFMASRNTGAARQGFIIVCDDLSGNCYPVTVSQASGEGLKIIPRHSLGMRFTATWCGYCPIMDETFRMARTKLGDSFEYMCLYDTSGNYGSGASGPLVSQYMIGGYPTGIIDGRFELQNYASSTGVNILENAVNETNRNYPAVTSVAISSSVSGRNVTVQAQVYADAADTYKVSAFLLEDAITGYQANYISGNTNSFVHNRVTRVQLSSSATGDQFSLESGRTKSFSWSATLPSNCKAENMVVLVYVQRPFGVRPVLQSDSYGEYYVDNSRAAALGSTAAAEWE